MCSTWVLSIWRDRINTFYTGNSGALGAIIFNGAFTSSNPTNVTPATGGYGGADFYLGLPSSYGKGIICRTVGPSRQHFCRVCSGRLESHRNLTINLGLRYETHTPWVEKRMTSKSTSIFSPDKCWRPIVHKVDLGTAPVTCKDSGNRGLYNGTYGAKHFQPRVGFAWTPASGRKDGLPRRFHYLVLSGGHGHEPSSPHQSALHQG